MDRKNKIKLLQNLSRGSVSLDELKPKQLKVKVDFLPLHEEGATYYINDKQVEKTEYMSEWDRQMSQRKKKGETVIVKRVSYNTEDE